MKTHLVIIDPQNDFCDPEGALYVTGAELDMSRLTSFLERNRAEISEIQVSLDSHKLEHIAHPVFWESAKGESPGPFTIIKKEDIEGDIPSWRPKNKKHFKKAAESLAALEKEGRYELCIWPPHCIIGTWGHEVYPLLLDSLNKYGTALKPITYVKKGSNLFTEHYSVIRAEVEDSEDPSTATNQAFLEKIVSADKVLFAGEARSHCVANTVRDIIAIEGKSFAKKCILLIDTMSDVPGFEAEGEAFIHDMKDLGMHIEKAEGLVLADYFRKAN